MLKEYTQLPRPVHILCLGMLLNRAGSFFIVFLTIYLSRELGFSIQFATLTIGAAGLGAMVGSIVGGQLADQLGRRIVMIFALLGSAAILVALSFVRQPIPFLIGIFCFSTIIDMYRPAASAMIGDLVKPENRQYSFGLMYISINMGFAIAPPLGGFLAEFSWQWLFWADAITTTIFGVVIWALIPETLPQPGTSEDESFTTRPDQPKRELSFAEASLRIASDRPFVTFCLATFLISVVFMQSVSTLPVAMMDLGISAAKYGRLIAINGVMIVVLQLPLTRLLSRYDRMSVIAIGGLLISIGFGMNAFAATTTFFAMAIAVWTFGEMFQAPFQQAVVTDLAPAELRGRYFGVYSMSHCMALTLGAPFGGMILERYGEQMLWNASLLTGLLAVALYVLARARIQQRFESPTIESIPEPVTIDTVSADR